MELRIRHVLVLYILERVIQHFYLQQHFIPLLLDLNFAIFVYSTYANSTDSDQRNPEGALQSSSRVIYHYQGLD